MKEQMDALTKAQAAWLADKRNGDKLDAVFEAEGELIAVGGTPADIIAAKGRAKK